MYNTCMGMIENIKMTLGAVVRIIVKDPKSLNDKVRHDVVNKSFIERLKLPIFRRKPNNG